jgi:hypothetical protein
MGAEKNTLLTNYYLDFCQYRKKHFDGYWKESVFKRILNRDSAVKEAVEAERIFLNAQLKQFSDLVDLKGIERECIIDFKCSLALYREEGAGRIGFIMIYVALMLMTVKIISKHLGVFEEALSLEILFEVSIFSVLSAVLLERGGISSRLSASLQLVTVIDRWLELNPEKVKKS